MWVCWVFSLESPHHRGDSNEYTQHIINNTKLSKLSSQIIENIIMSAATGPKNEFETAISVRAT